LANGSKSEKRRQRERESGKPYSRDGIVRHPTCQPFHTFFWNSQLPVSKMEEISDWIGSLKPHEKELLKLLISDIRTQESWDAKDSLNSL